jgi:hypothetical protein
VSPQVEGPVSTPVSTSYEVLRARNATAVERLCAGRVEEAGQLFAELLEDCHRTLGVNHVDTLIVAGNLASCRFRVAPGSATVALLEHEARERVRVLGAAHSMTLTAAEAMATGLRECGRLDEALDLWTEIVASRVRVLGRFHPGTLQSRLGLALVHVDLGELNIAAGELAGIDDDTVRADPAQRSTAVVALGHLALGHLAWCYSRLGWTTAARDVARRVAAETTVLFGAPHPLVRDLA